MAVALSAFGAHSFFLFSFSFSARVKDCVRIIDACSASSCQSTRAHSHAHTFTHTRAYTDQSSSTGPLTTLSTVLCRTNLSSFPARTPPVSDHKLSVSFLPSLSLSVRGRATWTMDTAMAMGHSRMAARSGEMRMLHCLSSLQLRVRCSCAFFVILYVLLPLMLSAPQHHDCDRCLV